MLQIGQTVQLMDTRDRGTIVQLYADGRVLVRLTDGLEIDVDQRDLAATAPAEAAKAAPGSPSKAPATARIEGLSEGLYLAIERPQPTRADLYLANLLPLGVVYAVYRPAPGSGSVHSRRTGLVHGFLQPHQVQLLFTGQGSEWERQFTDLVIEWLHFSAQPHEAFAPAQAAFKLRGRMLAQPGQVNPATGNPAVWLPLRPQAPSLEETLAQAAESAAKAAAQHRISGPPGRIVDLHIEVLDPDAVGMPAGEILQIQLEAFEKALSSALAHHLPDVTFIHGIGKGALRDAIHKRLRHNRHVRSFTLADHGSTVVKL